MLKHPITLCVAFSLDLSCLRWLARGSLNLERVQLNSQWFTSSFPLLLLFLQGCLVVGCSVEPPLYSGNSFIGHLSIAEAIFGVNWKFPLK